MVVIPCSNLSFALKAATCLAEKRPPGNPVKLKTLVVILGAVTVI